MKTFFLNLNKAFYNQTTFKTKFEVKNMFGITFNILTITLTPRAHSNLTETMHYFMPSACNFCTCRSKLLLNNFFLISGGGALDPLRVAAELE